MTRLLIVALAALASVGPSAANAEGPDPSFGDGGSVYLETLSKFGFSDVASGGDGSIAVTSSVNELVKLTAAGVPDAGFGEAGMVYPVPGFTDLVHSSFVCSPTVRSTSRSAIQDSC
jgi:hypothetical protein